MDFTSSYRHHSSDCTWFSPGSTFIASASGKPARTLLVRVSTTLQVIRSWDLDSDITSVEWSKDGAYIMVGSSSDNLLYIFSLDPAREVTDGSDDGRGWVARIEAGSEGLSAATWTPHASVPSVMSFSEDELRLTIHSLSGMSAATIDGPKNPVSMSAPRKQSRFALLERRAGKDTIGIYTYLSQEHTSQLASSRYSDDESEENGWQLERSFSVATNDAAQLAWSPDGRFIAVWENFLEYKLLIYTPTGYLRSTFLIDPNGTCDPITMAPHLESTAPSPPPHPTASLSHSLKQTLAQSKASNLAASVSSRRLRKDEDDLSVAGGGLGIRNVSWHPSGDFLAIGGYDEKIRVLESGEWTEVTTLDHSKKIIGSGTESSGELVAWREPRSWIEDTQGRGIVTYEIASLPAPIAAVRVDPQKANPKVGICSMEWSEDGTLLASRNENMPATVFIHSFGAESEDDPIPQPRLIAVLMQSAVVRSMAWKPGHLGKLAIACGGSAVYFWELVSEVSEDEDENIIETRRQIAEAVPVPIGNFSTTSLKWSPDGGKLLLMGPEAFCCALEAVDEEESHIPVDREDDHSIA